MTNLLLSLNHKYSDETVLRLLLPTDVGFAFQFDIPYWKIVSGKQLIILENQHLQTLSCDVIRRYVMSNKGLQYYPGIFSMVCTLIPLCDIYFLPNKKYTISFNCPWWLPTG